VEPTGPVVGAPANFTVETFSAGKGNVEVIVEDPRGQKIPVSSSLHNRGVVNVITQKNNVP
jgi:filamin